jgi:hypothetical protein
MMANNQASPRPPILRLLEPDEQVHAQAAAEDAIMLVTDRRLAVATTEDRFALDIPFQHLRRVQFDIERSRPATLVLVPESPADRPQVLTIPPDQYEATAQALALIGKHIYGQS